MRIERGAVIADRYVVSAIERPWLADRPEAGVVCLALDAILDDPVILYAADPEFAGDLVDAGRRLALINDPRVPSILDVGEGVTEDGEDVAYVVCSRTAATSLAEILGSGPIDSAPTRAIAGEVSEVLVHAARRGLHHRCLGPESIGITNDGDVVVHGIAIDAALSELALGLEPQQDAAALREDALAVIDVLYACLSGLWPKPESRAGLRPAPRKNTRVVDVERLRSDLPEDLYSFITGVTSRTDPGPRSPGEIIRYLREWDRGSLTELKGSPLPNEALFASQDAPVTEAAESSVDASDGVDASSAPEQSGLGPDDEAGKTAAADTAGTGVANTPSASSTSTGSGVGGAKPTSNTGAKQTGEPGGFARSSTGMGASGARPTATGKRPPAPAAPVKRSATPDQIQAALSRIGMTRPGTSGYSAGRADGVRTKLDERMQMREASVFPLSADQIQQAETTEWSPEDTIEEYSQLSEQEYDRNLTAPIVDRDALFTEDLETQQMPVITEEHLAASEGQRAGSGRTAPERSADGEAVGEGTENAAATPAPQPPARGQNAATGAGEDEGDDGSWFLGGMFTTREEEVAEQRAAFEREREREQRLNEEARTRALAAEEHRVRHRNAVESAAADADAKRVDAQAQGSSGTPTPARSRTEPAMSSSGPANTAGGIPTGTAGKRSERPASGDGRSATPGPAGRTAAGTAPVGASAGAGAGTSPMSTVSAGPATAMASGPPANLGSGAAPASATGSVRTPRRRRVAMTWTVIGIVLLVVAVVFGVIALGGLGEDPEDTVQPAPTAQPTQESEPETEEPEPEPEGPAPVVASVSDLDPEGDGSENPDMVDNVLPGEDGHWQTDRYNSAEFGNLKSGLGLVFELEEESLVSSVTLDSPDAGSTIEIRAGDSDSPEDAETIETAELDDETVTVEFDEPVTSQYVFVWYTELAPAGEGYRGQLDEVEIE